MSSLNHEKLVPALANLILIACGSIGLVGCATLPKSGPSGAQIEKDLVAQTPAGNIRVVRVEQVEDLPQPTTASVLALADLPESPTDTVGPGDVLDIAIYEAGITLFSGTGGAGGGQQPSFDPSVKAEKFPEIRVSDTGTISLPYAGKLHVSGLMTSEVGRLIKHSLRGFSQDPQVLVAIKTPITNSVIVGGEVTHSGRLVLQTNHESLNDVLALAGGYHGEAKDLAVRVTRAGNQVEFRLSSLVNGHGPDPRVFPGDRIQVVSQPFSYSVMGAAGKVALMSFGAADVTLAEAISQAGGADPRYGDPEAIFVFRMVPDGKGGFQSSVYHFNLMHPSGFFLAHQFHIIDKDVIYFGNARANQADKLLQLISQLFTPIITVVSAAQVLRN